MEEQEELQWYLADFLLLQASGEAGRVTLLVQVHLHELLDGQLAGRRVLELHQPDVGQGLRY